MTQLKSIPLERRRHPRTKLEMRLRGIRLDPDCGEVVEQLHMKDISKSGIGATSPRAFYPGQRIVLGIPVQSAGGKRNLYATVVRCRQTDDGYRVGMEFDNAAAEAYRQSDEQVVAAA
ncbi:MAG: PilZ domain-containing protein [Phycisphaerae bacterium]